MFFFPSRITSPIWPATQLHKQLRQHSGGTDHRRGLVPAAPLMKGKSLPELTPYTGLLQGPCVAVSISLSAGRYLAALLLSITWRAMSSEGRSILAIQGGNGCSAHGKWGPSCWFASLRCSLPVPCLSWKTGWERGGCLYWVTARSNVQFQVWNWGRIWLKDPVKTWGAFGGRGGRGRVGIWMLESLLF